MCVRIKPEVGTDIKSDPSQTQKRCTPMKNYGDRMINDEAYMSKSARMRRQANGTFHHVVGCCFDMLALVFIGELILLVWFTTSATNSVGANDALGMSINFYLCTDTIKLIDSTIVTYVMLNNGVPVFMSNALYVSESRPQNNEAWVSPPQIAGA